MKRFDMIHGAPYNKNNPFRCCFECEKKHPACSDNCPEHDEAKRQNEEMKRLQRLDSALRRAENTREIRERLDRKGAKHHE